MRARARARMATIERGYHLGKLESQNAYIYIMCLSLVNDPSEGSPTETLLRLLLPLSAPVRTSFSRNPLAACAATAASPRHSLVHPIGSSDGRCVQRAGTHSRWAQ